MTFWQTLWTIMFFASVGAFAILAVVISIGGFLNIRWMFRKLKSQDSESEASGE